MLRTKAAKTTATGLNGGTTNGIINESGEQWEMRPGGMLVQKRGPDSDLISSHLPPPPIRVRVKYGSIYHEIRLSPQATFGELKKMLSGPTGLHHQDQKLFFKDKERDSKAFLDVVGVKDRSKMVLVEDPISHEKRLLEMRRTAKMEKASKSISDISFEVDRLAGRVSAMDSVISRGGKIPETDVLGLIELLMNQLLKLDGITIADGDVKLQRKMQVKRVQKYVETLDMLKIKQATQNTNNVGDKSGEDQPQQQRRQTNGQSESNHHSNHRPAAEHPPRRSSSGTIVTTQWETFDSAAAVVSNHAVSKSAIAANSNQLHQPKFPWEFFE